MREIEDSKSKGDHGKIKSERLKEITRNVLGESDILIARENVEALTKLLKQEPFSQLMTLIKSFDDESRQESEIAPPVAFIEGGYDPFTNIEGLIEKLNTEDKPDFENQLDVLPGLGKLVRRTLYISVEYRVAREYVKEQKSNPGDVLQSLGQDVDIFSKLNERFKLFVRAVDDTSRYSESLLKRFEEHDLCGTLEIPVIVSMCPNIFNILIGGQTKEICDEEGNRVVDSKGIGLGYISSNAFVYNILPEMVPELLEIKKRVNKIRDDLKKCLTNSYSGIISRAEAMSLDYAKIVKESLERYLETPKEKLKEDEQVGPMFGQS